MSYTRQDFVEIERDWIVKGRPRCEHNGRWERVEVELRSTAARWGRTTGGMIRRENEAAEVRSAWS